MSLCGSVSLSFSSVSPNTCDASHDTPHDLQPHPHARTCSHTLAPHGRLVRLLRECEQVNLLVPRPHVWIIIDIRLSRCSDVAMPDRAPHLRVRARKMIGELILLAEGTLGRGESHIDCELNGSVVVHGTHWPQARGHDMHGRRKVPPGSLMRMMMNSSCW